MQLEHRTWKIIGTTPLLQNNPHGMWANAEAEALKGGQRKRPLYPGNTEAFKQAEKSLYVSEDGGFYHPTMAFMHSLFDACPKRSFGRESALGVITMAVRTVEDEFMLYDPETLDSKKPKLLGKKGWLVDKRRGWNEKVKAGIVCIRPKWKPWGGFLTLAIETSVTAQIKDFPQALTELLNVSGGLFGIGVGRIRSQGRKGTHGEKWGGLGTGRFQAELKH